MENFESQAYRDELAKTLQDSPAEARPEILDQAKTQSEYWRSRADRVGKAQDEEPIDDGLGVFIKRKTLYHGTGAEGIEDFNSAEDTTVGDGAYFTSDPNAAIGYAHVRTRGENETNPIIYEANIENARLVDLRKKANVEKVLPGFKEILKKERNKPDLHWAKQGRIDQVIGNIDSGLGAKYLKFATQGVGNLFSDYLSSLGYDGLITYEGGEGEVGDHDTYLIFDPEKAKINKEHIVR